MKLRPMTRATCLTCNRLPAAPYRRIVDGRTIEGCVDACHTEHVHGTSTEWHWRQDAIKIRKSTLDFLNGL